ncbi:MAG: VanZ family protein [Vicinamibacterales bacterium]|jgi:hypothetical protein|nr:VanZ family protein [Vicinamibacterales bacterium]
MRRYLLPVGVSLLFIAWSPYMGLVRDALKDALGDAFTLALGLLLAVTVLAVVTWGVRRVRARRLQGVGLMLTAVALFVGYAWMMRTGAPDVDAVERVHFVEYGLVATLFYRAMAGSSLAAVVPMTLLVGTLVGIGEEWVQWLVPTRVGDVRDVILNFYALGCGLLFAIGLAPPVSFSAGAPVCPWRRLATLASVVVVSFAAFYHSAHLGYELDDPAIGRFRSFFTVEQLSANAVDRAERWRRDPPTSLEPFSLQDHYLVEAAAHVQRRNEAYAAGQFRDAWFENALLETYYAPLLDQDSIGSGDPHRWPRAQRDEVELKGAGDADAGWTSVVYTDRVVTSPTKPILWVGAVLVAVSLWGVGMLIDRGLDVRRAGARLAWFLGVVALGATCACASGGGPTAPTGASASPDGGPGPPGQTPSLQNQVFPEVWSSNGFDGRTYEYKTNCAENFTVLETCFLWDVTAVVVETPNGGRFELNKDFNINAYSGEVTRRWVLYGPTGAGLPVPGMYQFRYFQGETLELTQDVSYSPETVGFPTNVQWRREGNDLVAEWTPHPACGTRCSSFLTAATSSATSSTGTSAAPACPPYRWPTARPARSMWRSSSAAATPTRNICRSSGDLPELQR